MSEDRTVSVGCGGVLSATSLLVTVGLAYAIETGMVDWSPWWLTLTGAPFVLTVLVSISALLGVAAISGWVASQLRRERR